ncbi:hypothetical protein CSE16_17360 [Solibacillus sp. R5-41]|uniref:hypothetical protein n=1 Tax=Solibacillus sp. R5-41 TaxID=2048654 RepID=UPI000C126EAE|nr:hypothetical protein [Solibacillus sp. R5-41]ATP41658.1 hypothetical protein CSE16_17360 [Solibacillus sp. R5-41]
MKNWTDEVVIEKSCASFHSKNAKLQSDGTAQYAEKFDAQGIKAGIQSKVEVFSYGIFLLNHSMMEMFFIYV